MMMEGADQFREFAQRGLTVEEVVEKTGMDPELIKDKAEELEIDIPYKDFKKEHGISKEDYSKSRFRTPKKWNVENRIIFGIMIVEDIKVSELAEMVGVTSRSIERWVFEGAKPSKKNQEKVAKVLKAPADLLFGRFAYECVNEERKNNNE